MKQQDFIGVMMITKDKDNTGLGYMETQGQQEVTCSAIVPHFHERLVCPVISTFSHLADAFIQSTGKLTHRRLLYLYRR